MKTCKKCLEEKPLSEFPKSGGMLCKLCFNLQASNRRFEKAAKRRPDKYMYCKDCYQIFYKYSTNTFTGYVPQVERTHCTKCNSENIEYFERKEQ